MLSALPTHPILYLVILFLIVVIVLLVTKRKNPGNFSHEAQLKLKLYELQIIDELNQNFGYSLSIENVTETIIQSLDKLFSYTTASYITLEGNKLKFKAHLNESVSKNYLDDLKSKMLMGVKLISPEDISKRLFEDAVDGNPINDLNVAVINSLFNVPLKINNSVIGIFTVTSTKSTTLTEKEIRLLYRIFANASTTITNLHALIEHEKGKLQVMVDSMYDGVLMIDKNFRILVVNPACYRLMGRDPSFTMNIFDAFDYFSNVFPMEEQIAKVFATGKLESTPELKLGDKYYEIVVIPVKSTEEIIGVGILIHDKSKEMELKKLRQDFTAMMVHELRSPLSVIKGTADLLEKEYKNLTSEQIGTFMKQIKESSINLLGIVNELLDESKIEAGKIELFKKLSDINQVLTDEFNYYYNLANDKGIQFSFDLDLSIKKISIDEQKVKQIMNNLLSNAIKFSEKGESIVISSKNYGSYIGVSVADTGKGVPEEVKEKIFQKFVQARASDKSNEPGTGLGLVICKGIADAHGGRIWVEDNQPKGAKFIFTLPIS